MNLKRRGLAVEERGLAVEKAEIAASRESCDRLLLYANLL